MTDRLDYLKQSPTLFKKLADFGQAASAGIDETLKLLVDIRASQLNGCAFCLDMHVKQATLHGERPLRLHHLAAWRESPLFDARERAALEWTEALTRLPEHGVSDAVYAAAREQFSEAELSSLAFIVATINAWNRVNIAFAVPPGRHDKAFGLDKAGLA